MSVSFSEQVSTPFSTTLTAKGQILTHNGTSGISVSSGTNGQILSAQSSTTSGLSYVSISTSTAYYSLISSSSLSASATSVEFSSIPSTYRHLELRFYGGLTGVSDDERLGIRLNSGSAASSYRIMGLKNASSMAESNTYGYIGRIVNPSHSTRTNWITQTSVTIFNYTNTSHYKCAIFNGEAQNIGQLETMQGAFHYSGTTSAITTVTIFPISAGFCSGTYVALYGIKS